MLNRATGQHAGDIRAMLVHLFSTHGKVTPQQVKAKEMEIYNMHHDISQPVDTVFNSIDDLSDLADHATAPAPMTEQQMIDLACVIFAKQPILQADIRLWNRRPAAERTYVNFTQHLRDAQTDLMISTINSPRIKQTLRMLLILSSNVSSTIRVPNCLLLLSNPLL